MLRQIGCVPRRGAEPPLRGAVEQLVVYLKRTESVGDLLGALYVLLVDSRKCHALLTQPPPLLAEASLQSYSHTNSEVLTRTSLLQVHQRPDLMAPPPYLAPGVGQEPDGTQQNIC